MSVFTLMTVARCSSYGQKPLRLKRKNTFPVNELNVSNSCWFMAGTLLRQPSGVNLQVHSYNLGKSDTMSLQH